MYHFFAYVSKLKYILRWGLKRNVEDENVKEHSFDVAVIAHALAIVKNRYFEGDLNAERIAVMALYHDASEVLTGDLPGPIKYFNPSIAEAYKEVEKAAEQKLITMLPDEMRADFLSLIDYKASGGEIASLIKSADIISAYLKCIQEVDAGNSEFVVAKERVELLLNDNAQPEVKFFLDNFVPSYRLTLDELG
ncbi:5'-deoxynucleotidase [Gammaproteobacteria bacterium 42_54_T18]|nr:5'-deoxynucleotidase [Gammaproteobacteria bacterium 42_54_T18]